MRRYAYSSLTLGRRQNGSNPARAMDPIAISLPRPSRSSDRPDSRWVRDAARNPIAANTRKMLVIVPPRAIFATDPVTKTSAVLPRNRTLPQSRTIAFRPFTGASARPRSNRVVGGLEAASDQPQAEVRRECDHRASESEQKVASQDLGAVPRGPASGTR